MLSIKSVYINSCVDSNTWSSLESHGNLNKRFYISRYKTSVNCTNLILMDHIIESIIFKMTDSILINKNKLIYKNQKLLIEYWNRSNLKLYLGNPFVANFFYPDSAWKEQNTYRLANLRKQIISLF